MFRLRGLAAISSGFSDSPETDRALRGWHRNALIQLTEFIELFAGRLVGNDETRECNEHRAFDSRGTADERERIDVAAFDEAPHDVVIGLRQSGERKEKQRVRLCALSEKLHEQRRAHTASPLEL